MPNPPFPRTRWRWLLLGILGITAIGAGAAILLFGVSRPQSEGPLPAADHWSEVAKGQDLLSRGRPDLALQAVMHIRDEAPGAGEAMTVAGVALFQLQDVKGARLALERALKIQPEQPKTAKALAQLYLMLGNGVRGAEVLQEAARLNPRDDKVWQTMGRVYDDLGDAANAARAYEESLRLNPADRETRVALIADLLTSNQADQATPWLTAALKDEPNESKLLGLAARHARDLGQAESAITFAEQALAQDPDNLDALLVRAKGQLAAGHREQALVDLQRASAAHPDDLGTLPLLAQVEAQLGHTEQAAQAMERHRRSQERLLLMDRLTQQIAARPDDPEPRWRLGQAAAERGEIQFAAGCFNAALALDPKYQPALDALAKLQTPRAEGTSEPRRPPSLPAHRGDFGRQDPPDPK